MSAGASSTRKCPSSASSLLPPTSAPNGRPFDGAARYPHTSEGSDAYKYGGYASLFVGLGRLGYAASAKIISKVAVDGIAASAGRNALKAVFRGGVATGYRAYTYEQMLGKYGTDEAVQAAAGRTSTLFNAPAADAVAGYFSNLDINGTGCGCK